MTLKEDIIKDIDSVFLNLDDFAEEHSFDNNNILCVVDEETLNAQKLKDAKGTYVGSKLIYVNVNQLKGKPVNGARIKFDDTYYFVTKVVENYGMYSITLDVNKPS